MRPFVCPPHWCAFANDNKRTHGCDVVSPPPRIEQIMVLTAFCPWKGHLLELEEEMGIAGELKYVLYAEGDPAGKWRIQVCVYEGAWVCRNITEDKIRNRFEVYTAA